MNTIQSNFNLIFEEDLLAEINEIAIVQDIPEGETLVEIGQFVKYIPLLLSGNIKVIREDEDANELLLYFLEKGDTCAMTLNCCMGKTQSEIRAIAETDVTVAMIPVQKMDEWMVKYKSWRQFILESYNNRFMEVLETLDSIAFMNMDERLLKYLINKVKISKSKIIENTHQEIADDLNTSRVVISRLLKNLEKKNTIQLSRNNIKYLLD